MQQNKTKLVYAGGTLVVLAIAAVLVASVFKSSGGTNSYEASVLSVKPLNKPTVLVEYKVINKGNRSGSPLCTITVGNSSYSGNNEFVMSSKLAPNQSIERNEQVVVNGSGSDKVSSGSISCS